MADTVNALLIPGAATATTATVWCGLLFLNAPPAAPATARVQRASGAQLPIATWETWAPDDGGCGVVYARITITGLTPRTKERVSLVVDNAVVAIATIGTLPDALPGMDDPFRLMLGSCFCAAEDREGRLGRAFSAVLNTALRPELKLLCGDQVYLDAPFYKFIYPRRNRSLARTFLQNYADTWGQNGDGVGFHQVLSNGPNVFTADDHEFWNNAPFPSFAANSVLKGSRKAWFDMALGLYRAFQTEAPLVQSLEIGELSIRMVDTRVARSDDRTTLIPDSEMDDLEAWIRGLRAPGILAIGQPVFAAPAGFLSKLADWNLPDFTQYERLCKALLEAPQSVLILTGDVHFGRAARVVTDRGAEIVEIVASPMSLVTGLGGRGWHAAPPKLPAHAIKKVASQEIERLGTWERAEDHFLILELWSTGGGLGVRGHSFEANPKGTPPSNPVFTHTFRRQA